MAFPPRLFRREEGDVGMQKRTGRPGDAQMGVMDWVEGPAEDDEPFLLALIRHLLSRQDYALLRLRLAVKDDDPADPVDDLAVKPACEQFG